MKRADPFFTRAGIHVTRSKSRGEPPRAFPTHPTVKPFTPQKDALPVNRSKRGPEKSKPVRVGKKQAVQKAVRRDLFNPRRRPTP